VVVTGRVLSLSSYHTSHFASHALRSIIQVKLGGLFETDRE